MASSLPVSSSVPSRGATWTSAENGLFLKALIDCSCFDSKSAKQWDNVKTAFVTTRTLQTMQDHLTDLLRYVSTAVMKASAKGILDPAGPLFPKDKDLETELDAYPRTLHEMMILKTETSSKDYGSSKWWSEDVVKQVLVIIRNRAVKPDTIENIEKAEKERQNKFDQEKAAKARQIRDMREEEGAAKKQRTDREIAFQENDVEKIKQMKIFADSNKRSTDAYVANMERNAAASTSSSAASASTERRLTTIEDTLATILKAVQNQGNK